MIVINACYNKMLSPLVYTLLALIAVICVAVPTKGCQRPKPCTSSITIAPTTEYRKEIKINSLSIYLL